MLYVVDMHLHDVRQIPVADSTASKVFQGYKSVTSLVSFVLCKVTWKGIPCLNPIPSAHHTALPFLCPILL